MDNAKLIAELDAAIADCKRCYEAVVVHGDQSERDAAAKFIGLLERCRAALSAQSEPVAWMHDCQKPNDCDAEDGAVISARSKAIWMEAKPEQVEHYTIPLYAHPVASAQAPREIVEALIAAKKALAVASGHIPTNSLNYTLVRQANGKVAIALRIAGASDAALAEPGATELWPGRACTYRPRDDVTCLKPECRFDCAAWLKDHANG